MVHVGKNIRVHAFATLTFGLFLLSLASSTLSLGRFLFTSTKIHQGRAIFKKWRDMGVPINCQKKKNGLHWGDLRITSWWLNQPIWNRVKMGIFLNFRGENKTYLSCLHPDNHYKWSYGSLLITAFWGPPAHLVPSSKLCTNSSKQSMGDSYLSQTMSFERCTHVIPWSWSWSYRHQYGYIKNNIDVGIYKFTLHIISYCRYDTYFLNPNVHHTWWI